MKEFPSNMECNYAEKFKKEVVKLLASGDSVYLDLQKVERISLSCVQILMAAKRKADKDNISLLIKSSEALDQVIADLGLENAVQTERVS